MEHAVYVQKLKELLRNKKSLEKFGGLNFNSYIRCQNNIIPATCVWS